MASASGSRRFQLHCPAADCCFFPHDVCVCLFFLCLFSSRLSSGRIRRPVDSFAPTISFDTSKRKSGGSGATEAAEEKQTNKSGESKEKPIAVDDASPPPPAAKSTPRGRSISPSVSSSRSVSPSTAVGLTSPRASTRVRKSITPAHKLDVTDKEMRAIEKLIMQERDEPTTKKRKSRGDEEKSKEDDTEDDGENDGNSDSEYVLERIVSVKRSGRGYSFLVKWQGFPEDQNTWEPERNIQDTAAYQKYKKEHDLDQEVTKAKTQSAQPPKKKVQTQQNQRTHTTIFCTCGCASDPFLLSSLPVSPSFLFQSKSSASGSASVAIDLSADDSEPMSVDHDESSESAPSSSDAATPAKAARGRPKKSQGAAPAAVTPAASSAAASTDGELAPLFSSAFNRSALNAPRPKHIPAELAVFRLDANHHLEWVDARDIVRAYDSKQADAAAPSSSKPADPAPLAAATVPVSEPQVESTANESTSAVHDADADAAPAADEHEHKQAVRQDTEATAATTVQPDNELEEEQN